MNSKNKNDPTTGPSTNYPCPKCNGPWGDNPCNDPSHINFVQSQVILKAWKALEKYGHDEGFLDEEIDKLGARVEELEKERDNLQAWVHDCQAGMYINCVYCGHRYGPDDEVPATMADVLKEHVEKCPKHPMSALKKECDGLQAQIDSIRKDIEEGRLVLLDFKGKIRQGLSDEILDEYGF